MKVFKLNEKEDITRSCLKDVRVKLTRLSKETINKMLGKNTNVDKNYNLLITMENGIWKCIEKSGSIVSVVSNNTITLSLRKPVVEEKSNSYGLRHKPGANTLKKTGHKVPSTTLSEISIAMQKRNVWSNCKKMLNKSKLTENAIVLAKQAGHSPWPSIIEKFTKTRSSATVKYFGFNNLTGTVKSVDLVQIDDDSKEAVGAYISFVLKSKCIRDHESFGKAVQELQYAMNVGFN